VCVCLSLSLSLWSLSEFNFFGSTYILVVNREEDSKCFLLLPHTRCKNQEEPKQEAAEQERKK
jgi:hypothetical protein